MVIGKGLIVVCVHTQGTSNPSYLYTPHLLADTSILSHTAVLVKVLINEAQH